MTFCDIGSPVYLDVLPVDFQLHITVGYVVSFTFARNSKVFTEHIHALRTVVTGAKTVNTVLQHAMAEKQ